MALRIRNSIELLAKFVAKLLMVKCMSPTLKEKSFIGISLKNKPNWKNKSRSAPKPGPDKLANLRECAGIASVRQHQHAIKPVTIK